MAVDTEEAMLVRVQSENFSIDQEIDRVRARSKRIGGITTFLGTARDRSKGRDVSAMTFDHYEGMAQKKLREIRERALQDFDVIEVLVLHRYGPIEIGENIVLIVVGAEHRADAFKACQWCIDELKKNYAYLEIGTHSGGGGVGRRTSMTVSERFDPASPVHDIWGRPLKALRLSVTDRCNLRCQYCMPEEEYVWLPRENLLTFEEISRLTGVFCELGVDKVRITGGEPLLRKNLPALVRLLRQNARIQDIALTTNGVLLAEQAQALCEAGLHRVTVSLDTLKPSRFKALTKRNTLDQVLDGIQSVGQAGFTGLKLDTVAIRGYNDDELIDLIEYGKQVQGEVRFIEYMDVGGATDWSPEKVFSREAMLKVFTHRYGTIEPIVEESSAPAQRFRLSDGTTFGIIPSTTTPFCSTCDRSRLTADGMWYLCLYGKTGIDLRQPLRENGSPESLKSRILSGWQTRRDRGAEERKALERDNSRSQFVEIERLREDPHLEMHARGG